MLKINVPDAAWSEQPVSLDGKEYRFVFKFNERDSRWRLDIFLGGTEIISGAKIMENQFLVAVPYYPENFRHGDIYCIRMRQDGKPCTRDNLGFGKAYELVYMTLAEIQQL